MENKYRNISCSVCTLIHLLTFNSKIRNTYMKGKRELCSQFQIHVSYLFKSEFCSSFKNNLLMSHCMPSTFMLDVSLTTPDFICKFNSYLTENICALNTKTSRLNVCGSHSLLFGFYETCVKITSVRLILRQVLRTQTNFLYGVTSFMA
jgi:hypothetical protein